MNSLLESKTLSRWLSEIVQIFLFGVVFIVSGCGKASSEQLYHVSEAGFSIEKPKNWRIEYFERSGLSLLESKDNFGENSSARIEIYGNACQQSSWATRLEEALEFNVERIRILYNLESVVVIQEPARVETKNNEIIKTVVAIPSVAMIDDMSRVQIGDPDPGTQQVIDLLVISDKVHYLMAYIYEGDNQDLNTKAQEIIESIQFKCSEDVSSQ